MLRKNGQDSMRDVLRVPAVLVLILVEVQMNTGAWRVLYPLLAVTLLSPFAQKLWAALLVARVLLISVVSWPPLEQLMLFDFSIIRIVFVWIMVLQHKLLAANRLVAALGTVVSRYGWVFRLVLVGTAVVVAVALIFFNIAKPHLLGLIMVFLAYLAILVPRGAGKRLPRRRTGLPEIGLAAASIILGLLIFEVAARLLVPDTIGRLYKLHPRSIACLAENTTVSQVTEEFSCTYTTSDQGLRDHHYGEKDESTYRILCVGDSFTMGYGVQLDKTYVKVLEQLLARQNLSKRAEVINGGTANYGVWQELILLEEKGLPLEPDLVILQVEPVSDVHNALMRVGKVLRSYEPWYPIDMAWCRGKHTVITRAAMRSRRWSRAMTLVFDRFASPRSPLIQYLRPRFRAWEPSIPPPETERPWWLESDLRVYYPEIEESWRLMESSIREMAEVCRLNGIRFSVFSVPDASKVYPDVFDRAMHDYNLDPHMYDLDKSRRLVKRICDRGGIDFVDIFPSFVQERDDAEQLYYVRDGHWTAEAHTLCARILCRHLLKTHLRQLARPSDEPTQG